MIRILMAAMLVLAMSAGCGKGFSGPCRDRSGSYLATLTTVSGNCGELGTMVVVLNSGPLQSCQTISEGNCVVTTDRCVSCADGICITMTGVVEWSEDGNTADGTVSISVAGVCSGTYDIDYRRVR